MKNLFSVIFTLVACAAAQAIILPYGPSPGRTANFEEGTTVAVDGYVVSGRLISGVNQSLFYNVTESVLLSGGSTVSFAGGYVSQGLTAYSSTVDLKQGISYASGRKFYVKVGTQVKFSGSYMVEGMPAYDQAIQYDFGTTAYMSPNSPVKIVGGFMSEGRLSLLNSYHTMPYGPARTVTINGGSYVYFGGVNVVNGKRYLRRGQKSQYAEGLKISATQTVVAPAYSTVNFSAGYYVP